MPLITFAGSDHGPENRQPFRCRNRSGLSDRQEELLSYLTGLGPVGEPVEIAKETLFSDVGLLSSCRRSVWCHLLNKLIAAGFVKRLSCGSGRATGLLVVLKRLEA